MRWRDDFGGGQTNICGIQGENSLWGGAAMREEEELNLLLISYVPTQFGEEIFPRHKWINMVSRDRSNQTETPIHHVS